MPKSGLADFVGESDEHCLDLTKKLLGYLPTNMNETPLW